MTCIVVMRGVPHGPQLPEWRWWVGAAHAVDTCERLACCFGFGSIVPRLHSSRAHAFAAAAIFHKSTAYLTHFVMVFTQYTEQLQCDCEMFNATEVCTRGCWIVVQIVLLRCRLQCDRTIGDKLPRGTMVSSRRNLPFLAYTHTHTRFCVLVQGILITDTVNI